MNVHSGKALDLWDGAWRDDAEIVQLGYWHGTQQRWVLTACDAATTSRAVMTIVRNESVFLPIWLRYYRQFFSAQDMYVLDHQSTDGSTEGHGFVRVPVSHPEYGAGWQRDVVQCSQHELVGRYDVVLCTDVDEIVAPDPRLGDLGTYIDRFDEDFITCQGYEILHRKDIESPFDPTRPVLRQRLRGMLIHYIPSLYWRACRCCGTAGVMNASMAEQTTTHTCTSFIFTVWTTTSAWPATMTASVFRSRR
jgi:Glycosyl transferase family 2